VNAGGQGSINPVGGWNPIKPGGDMPSGGGPVGDYPVTGGWMPPRDAGGQGSIPPGTGGIRPPQYGAPSGIQRQANPTGGYMPPRPPEVATGGVATYTKPLVTGGPSGVQSTQPAYPPQGTAKGEQWKPSPQQPIYTRPKQVGPDKPGQAYPAPTQGQGLYKKPPSPTGVGIAAPPQQSPPYIPQRKPELM